MNNQLSNDGTEEQSLVKLYAELTGTTETSARGVFMYLSQDGEGTGDATGISLVEKP